MLITLVNGGAIVDFRSKTDGSTAMHRAVTKNSIEGKVMGVESLTFSYPLNQDILQNWLFHLNISIIGYSGNKIIKTWIQISHHYWFCFFLKY